MCQAGDFDSSDGQAEDDEEIELQLAIWEKDRQESEGGVLGGKDEDVEEHPEEEDVYTRNRSRTLSSGTTFGRFGYQTEATQPIQSGAIHSEVLLVLCFKAAHPFPGGCLRSV